MITIDRSYIDSSGNVQDLIAVRILKRGVVLIIIHRI